MTTVIRYSSPWCLQRFGQYIGRPGSSSAGATDVIDDSTKYEWLSQAQDEVVADLAAVDPDVLYPTDALSATPTMQTADNQTFTFGLDDDGNPLAPIGDVGIYRSLNDIPTAPMAAGIDYVPLGASAIQMLNNTTYSGTLYYRGIFPAPALSKNQDPVLMPVASRALIPLRAAITFSTDSNRDPDLAATLVPRYSELWMSYCLVWRKQFARGGALGTWTGRRLALSGYTNSALSTYPYPI